MVTLFLTFEFHGLGWTSCYIMTFEAAVDITESNYAKNWLIGVCFRVVSLCVSPRSEIALSASLDHTVRIWDLRNNVCQVQGGSHLFLVITVLLHKKDHIANLCFRVCFGYQEDHQSHVIGKGSFSGYQWKEELWNCTMWGILTRLGLSIS
jgi:hypothetical protein